MRYCHHHHRWKTKQTKTHPHTYMYELHMKSTFPKRNKCQSKTQGSNANAKFRDPEQEKLFHKYVHKYAYIHDIFMCGKINPFKKHIL